MLSIVKKKSDKRPLNRIAINEGKTFIYKNNSCIWMSRKISFQNYLRIDNFGLKKGRHVLSMPIRLTQVGALRYDPGHVRLPSDPFGISASLP